MKLIDIVKDNVVRFDRMTKEYAYYNVEVDGKTFNFPVDLSEIGDATFYAEDKAMLFMRYIRKAMKDNTLVETV